MATSKDLLDLLRDLRVAGSPLQKMRLLAAGWKKLRRLSPDERWRLAKQVGLDEAEDLIEQLAQDEDGISAVELSAVVDQARHLDSSEARRLFRDLRDPSKRREMFRRGLDKFRERLTPPAEAERPIRSAGPTPVTEDSAADAPQPLEARPESPAGAGVSAETTSAPPPPVAVADRPARPRAAEPAVQDGGPPPATDRPREAAAAVVPFDRQRRGPSAAGRAARPVSSTDVDALLERLCATDSLMKRFRFLRDSLGSLGGSGGQALLAVVQSFPAGWARRRAVTMLLRAGIPQDTRAAVRLIESLEDPGGRRWSALALAASRELDSAEAALLYEKFPFPVLRRRLGIPSVSGIDARP